MNFYTDIDFFKSNKISEDTMVPFLYPFLNYKMPIDIDMRRFDVWYEKAKQLYALTDLNSADFVVLPIKIECITSNIISKAISEFILKVGKKPIVYFYNSDNDKEYNLHNGVLFRTSFYKTTKQDNEFAYPAWSDYYGCLPNYDKKDLPTIAFCGFVSEHRKKALDVLQKDSRVCCDFIFKPTFFGFISSEDKIKARLEFVQNLNNSLYAFCCRGGGNFSYRLYEALSLGRIPVLLDTDCVLPFEDFIDWNKHIIRVSKEENLVTKILEFHNSKSNEDLKEIQRNNNTFWLEWLSPQGFFEKMSTVLYTKRMI